MPTPSRARRPRAAATPPPRLSDPEPSALTSHDRLTRVEARLARIEHELKRLTSYLMNPPNRRSDYPDANLGVN